MSDKLMTDTISEEGFVFRQVNQRSVVDAIREEILMLILRGELVPGMKLPSEKELISQLGVSRAALREALRMMAGEELLEIRPGRGTFVAQPTAASAIQSEVVSLLLMQEDLNDILQVRRILEPEIAAIVAEKATDSDIDQLERILDQYKQSIRILDHHEQSAGMQVNCFDHAWEFHCYLAQAAGNKALAKIADILYEMIREYERPIYADCFDFSEELQEHRAILDAIKRRDAGRARKVMISHLEYIAERVGGERIRRL